MPRTTGRPRRTSPARRFQITLDEADHALLTAYAKELGRPTARIAGLIVQQTIRAGRGSDGRVDRAGVEAVIRQLNGEVAPRSNDQPRWEWPLEAILADREWLDRWLPDLYELLGRRLTPPADPSQLSQPEPVLDSRGYSDLMEFLFPSVNSAQGAASWRSSRYPALAGKPELAPVWEAVIRHLMVALDAIERSARPDADPSYRMLIQDQIRGSWLSTLRSLAGESPAQLPRERPV